MMYVKIYIYIFIEWERGYYFYYYWLQQSSVTNKQRWRERERERGVTQWQSGWLKWGQVSTSTTPNPSSSKQGHVSIRLIYATTFFLKYFRFYFLFFLGRVCVWSRPRQDGPTWLDLKWGPKKGLGSTGNIPFLWKKQWFKAKADGNPPPIRKKNITRQQRQRNFKKS